MLMTSCRISRLIMTTTTVLIARTISISGARMMASSNSEYGLLISEDQNCGCLSEPPQFDLPPPPVPPLIDFDWSNVFKSDPSFESCQNEVDKWSTPEMVIPRWTVSDGDEIADDFNTTTPVGPRFFGIFDQPLTVFIIIAAMASVVLLLICLLAFFCKRKPSGNNCVGCGYETKDSVSYQNRHVYSPSSVSSSNGRRRSHQGDLKFRSAIDAASPATTTTTVMANKCGYHRPTYNLSNAVDSADDMSDGENDYFLKHPCDSGPTAPTEWSYNAMRPAKGNGNGVHTRISGNFNGAPKYGSIPTDPPAYERSQKPLVVLKTDNGHVVSATSRSDHPLPFLYDSHNPIYEEISLHEKSYDRYADQQRRLSQGVVNYADSGASSASSQSNSPLADGHYVVDQNNSLTVVHSPCCSSGRSDCEECCTDEQCRHHVKKACPFSPRPRQKPIFNPSITPSPIRQKSQSNKINRSTQSGESCLGGNDELYTNCCECSGRESGYGTDRKRQSSLQSRLRNQRKAANGMQTMDATTGVQKWNERTKYYEKPSRFYTVNGLPKSPVVIARPMITHGSNSILASNMDNPINHMHNSAFV